MLRWWFLTQFSSMISKSAVAHIGWWFLPSTLFPANQFRDQIMVSATNQFSLLNYGVNSESVSLLNCDVTSESVFAAKFAESVAAEFVESAMNQFRCRIVESAANQFSWPNCVVSSELVFPAKLCCQ